MAAGVFEGMGLGGGFGRVIGGSDGAKPVQCTDFRRGGLVGLEVDAAAEISPLSRFCAVVVVLGNEASVFGRFILLAVLLEWLSVWSFRRSVFWAVRTVQSRYSAPISAVEVWVGLEVDAAAEISPLSRFCAVVVV